MPEVNRRNNLKYSKTIFTEGELDRDKLLYIIKINDLGINYKDIEQNI